MSFRSTNSATAEKAAVVREMDLQIPTDPSEVFLSRQAQWRLEAAKRRTMSASSGDFDGWFRGDTSSEAFSPSNYGLKGN